jgi:hypothetical protein
MPERDRVPYKSLRFITVPTACTLAVVHSPGVQAYVMTLATAPSAMCLSGSS